MDINDRYNQKDDANDMTKECISCGPIEVEDHSEWINHLNEVHANKDTTVIEKDEEDDKGKASEES